MSSPRASRGRLSLSVVFTPEAEDQLVELHRYIAAAGSAEVAARYVESIVVFCEDLGVFHASWQGSLPPLSVTANPNLARLHDYFTRLNPERTRTRAIHQLEAMGYQVTLSHPS